MVDMTNESCRAFVEALASPSPTPGGGGAAALVGAIGTALGRMVGSLTVGKKKYAGVEEEMRSLMARCASLQSGLLDCVQSDAEGFAPLAAAYAIPKDNPDRDRQLREATIRACQAPMEIMLLCCEALQAIRVFAEKGSRLAVSDAGCAALTCKAALMSASLNVFVNTRTLPPEQAEAFNSRANEMLGTYCPMADEIYAAVRAQLN